MIQIRTMSLVNDPFELMFREMPKALERNSIEVTRRDSHNQEIEGRMILNPPWNKPKVHMKLYHNAGHTLIVASVKKRSGFRKNGLMKRLMESLVDDIERIGRD